MNPIIDTLEQRIATVVECSLQYLYNVSDHMSLAESHIKYPLVEFLERKKQCKEIALEVPMQQFYYRRHDATFSCEGQQIVMEFKYLRDDKISEHEIQRIFDDILRLRYALDTGYSKALMLICGQAEKFIPSFKGNDKVVDNGSIQEHIAGQRTETETTQLGKWFPLNQGKRETIKFDNNNKAYFEDFESRYITHYKNKATDKNPYNPQYISEVSHDIQIALSLKTADIIGANKDYPSYIVSIWEISR